VRSFATPGPTSGTRRRKEASRRAAEDLDRLRTQATITWRNDELKQAYEWALAKRHESQLTGAPVAQ
jgi:hypothetical protein